MRHLILSNYGLRFLQHQSVRTGSQELESAPFIPLLAQLLETGVQLFKPQDPQQRVLVERGLAQPSDLDARAAQLRYRRNPLENIERVVFEYTTLCNLNCLHCRNGHIPPATESRPSALNDVVDLMVPLNVKRFDFIGGEVMLYGRGWLDVVRHIRSHSGSIASVLTSGWFLGETRFRAAGVWYADDMEYLQALRAAGLTHVVFSLDGPPELHDQWRGVPGLYARILDGFAKAREAALCPQVSIVLRPGGGPFWLSDVVDRLYGLPANSSLEAKLELLIGGKMNYASNLICIGNAVKLGKGKFRTKDVPAELLRCKNFFRPSPSLRIQATGEVSLCPLIDSGEGYGNIHERGLLSVLNQMQESFVYQLHAEGRMAEYRELLNLSIFGDRIDHLCSLRSVITSLARRIEEGGIDPSDTAAIFRVNMEVARRAGFLEASGRVSTGIRLPYGGE